MEPKDIGDVLKCDLRSLSARIIAYEEGEMDFDEVVQLFQDLLDTGTVWHLQGCYQRTAQQLLQQGRITRRR
jgi:hypothetical protein